MAQKRERVSRRANRSVVLDVPGIAGILAEELGVLCNAFDITSSRVRSGNWSDIFDADQPDVTISCHRRFAVDWLARSLLSKYPVRGFRDQRGRELVALEKFRDGEVRCLSTNERFSREFHGFSFSKELSVDSVISTARFKIGALLGDFCWDKAVSFAGFSPGATFSRSRSYGDPYYKIGLQPDCTASCLPLALACIAHHDMWYWCQAERVGGPVGATDLSVVPGNRVVTVPKNAKTERVIAIEPLMNVFLQKGIGGLIRQRLRRVGIDLNDQTANQKAACEGSLTGRLATIDLSNASDSLALKVVECLMPPDWFEAIQLLRSETGTLPSGDTVRYQKVSSMGNGFTFELESLIFWALCSSVAEILKAPGRREILVYGDDIVVPTEIASAVIDVLDYFGFATNATKTFVDGPFRESCGKHYFNGHDVTPFYIREDVRGIDRLVWFHNQLDLWFSRCLGVDFFYTDMRAELRRKFPEWFKLLACPREDRFLSTGIFSPWDEATPTVRRFGAYTVRRLVQRSKSTVMGDYAWLARQLYVSSPVYTPFSRPKAGLVRGSGTLSVTSDIVFGWR